VTTTDSIDARPLRATIVLNWAALGGAERRALMLARWLRDERRAHVEVLALTDRDGRAAASARELGIPWRSSPVAWDGSKRAKALELSRFTTALRRSRPDLVLPFCSLPNVLCALVWRLAGASTCVWYQADVSPFSRMRETTKRRAARRAPVLVANSDHAARHLVDAWGADPLRIRVVRAGIEPPVPLHSRSEWRARLGLEDDDLVACMVAHFRRSKDHATLIRAWRLVVDRLADTGCRAVLLLAGDGYPMGDAAKAQAFDLHLDGSVLFLGEVADVAGLVGASDIGVLSSFREGFPVSLLECMASGLPVCGSDIAGICEVVGAAGADFLAPSGDPDALAEAILRLAADGDLRRRIGASNRELVLGEYTPRRMLDTYADVISTALASGRRASR
jgi:glycosyltransferase involved in cell wall biosynthesis